MPAPSWETLQRLAAACGQRLRLDVEVEPDPEDIELAEGLLRLYAPRAPARPVSLFPSARGRATGAALTELDPERLLRALVEHGVEFCVIGAAAAWLQGNPTVTLDLDVMPRRDLGNADHLAAALNSLRARPRDGDTAAELEGGDFAGWQTRRFDTDAGPLDVVPMAAAIGAFEDVATIELALGDISVRVIAIDEVIASKKQLGRPKDTAALPALYATREALRPRRGGR